MAWTWRIETADGRALDAADEFVQRSDAETWLGEKWVEFAAAGASRAVLHRDDAVVGPAIDLTVVADDE